MMIERAHPFHIDPQVSEQGYNLYGPLAIFSGTANRPLTQEICDYLGILPGKADIFQFANSNTFVRLNESVRGKDVFVVQPTGAPTNDNLMELLIFIETLRRDSAARITAVIPYYGYGRTDKKDQPRVPVTARLVADLITTAGADRLLTMDLHAGQVQGFFTIPTDELTAYHSMVEYFLQKELTNAVVVAPDIGSVRRSRNFAAALDLPLAIIEKRRSLADGRTTQMFNIIGQVAGKDAILVDDEIDTAGTIAKAAEFLRSAEALDIYGAATHAVFSDPAAERIRQSEFTELVVTNTLHLPPEKRCAKITILSMGKLLGEVILRIHKGLSVGEIFNE
ncbi:MAG: ribose-phosphate pyrophosphokinase [Caldilineaceae bacterium]|nr:ribose-phosphate pyrophosphokinase [Caldilineaceae bacterium]MBP8106012.1 ribose-phosphate pyrophosphokinase [Caldilineaceae bacterium]MBP8123126.1 ribose-phosphate pyrophosphokinase [Caldilineaceae bacterium]MBP9071932.1 ribose-phosphate pyrophosphokinase [Caldilineaceae bacterium]